MMKKRPVLKIVELLLFALQIRLGSALDVCTARSTLLESGQISSPQHPSPAPAGPSRCRCNLSVDRESLQQVRQAEPGDWQLRLIQAGVVLGCRQRLTVSTDSKQPLLQVPSTAGKTDCNPYVHMFPHQLDLVTSDQSVELVYETWTPQAGGKFAIHFGTFNEQSSVPNLAKVQVTCNGNELNSQADTTHTVSHIKPTTSFKNKTAVSGLSKSRRESKAEKKESRNTLIMILVGVLGGIGMTLIVVIFIVVLYRRRTHRTRSRKMEKVKEGGEQHDSLLQTRNLPHVLPTYHPTKTTESQENESQGRDSAYRSDRSSLDNDRYTDTESCGEGVCLEQNLAVSERTLRCKDVESRSKHSEEIVSEKRKKNRLSEKSEEPQLTNVNTILVQTFFEKGPTVSAV